MWCEILVVVKGHVVMCVKVQKRLFEGSESPVTEFKRHPFLGWNTRSRVGTQNTRFKVQKSLNYTDEKKSTLIRKSLDIQVLLTQFSLSESASDYHRSH